MRHAKMNISPTFNKPDGREKCYLILPSVFLFYRIIFNLSDEGSPSINYGSMFFT